MIIRRLRLTNWKNFQDLDITLSNRALIIGANASGKSNLLDAIRFLRDICRREGGGLQQAISTRGGITRMRCLAARQNPKIKLVIELGDTGSSPAAWTYEIEFQLETSGRRRHLLNVERVCKDGSVLLDRERRPGEGDAEEFTETHLESSLMNKQFRDIAEYLGAVSYVHLVPQLLRETQSTEIENRSDDIYGKNFLSRIAKLPEKTRKSRLKRIGTALHSAIPQFEEIRERKDDAGRPHLEMRLKHWRPNAGWQLENQFSDGTIRLMGLLWTLLETDSVFLFEEPELSLNDRIVAQIPSLLHRLQSGKGRQVMLTTHSFSLISAKGVDLSEVIVLLQGPESTTATRASDIPEAVRQMEAGFSLGEILLPMVDPADPRELSNV